MMLRFTYKILGFLLFAVIAYVILVIVWSEINYNSYLKSNVMYELNLNREYKANKQMDSYGHLVTRINELKTISDVDILLMGSSQAYRGLDPRAFTRAGIKTFNLGSSNQTPLQSLVLLKRYLKQLNPKQIIYVVYPETFTMDGVESTFNLLTSDKVDFEIAKLALSQQNLKVLNTLIYAFYRDVFNLNRDYVEPLKKGRDTYIPGGYVERELSYYKYGTFEETTWEFNDKQFDAFDAFVDIIKNENVELILIQSPTPKSFYNSQTNNDEFDEIMKGYAEYYNFNNFVTLDDSLHFYDEFHLNKDGVYIFNEILINILQSKK